MALNFSSLKSDAGLKQLDAYLASRVYVFGLMPLCRHTRITLVIAASKDPRNILACHGSNRVSAIAALLLTGSTGPIGSSAQTALVALAGKSSS